MSEKADELACWLEEQDPRITSVTVEADKPPWYRLVATVEGFDDIGGLAQFKGFFTEELLQDDMALGPVLLKQLQGGANDMADGDIDIE